MTEHKLLINSGRLFLSERHCKWNESESKLHGMVERSWREIELAYPRAAKRQGDDDRLYEILV